MTLYIKHRQLAYAVEGIMIAARNVRDEQGLLCPMELPQLSKPTVHPSGIIDSTDYEKIHTVVVDALSTLCGQPIVYIAEPNELADFKGAV